MVSRSSCLLAAGGMGGSGHAGPALFPRLQCRRCSRPGVMGWGDGSRGLITCAKAAKILGVSLQALLQGLRRVILRHQLVNGRKMVDSHRLVKRWKGVAPMAALAQRGWEAIAPSTRERISAPKIREENPATRLSKRCTVATSPWRR